MPRLLSILLFLCLLGGAVSGSAFTRPPDAPAADALLFPANEPPPAPRLTGGFEMQFSCAYSPQRAALVNSLNAENWSAWIARLSGEEEVLVGGQPVTITTRYSYHLFNGVSPAFEYVKETVENWYPGQVAEETYTFYNEQWKNLILTLPGAAPNPYTVLLTAHLDSIASDSSGYPTPYSHAPGADDNATGSAALLEIARLLQGRAFPNTIRLIWFSGEEQGLLGSGAYTVGHDLSRVAGVINLDMYGYDSDDDRCFEIHAGSLPQSNRVGQCLAQAIDEYDLGLSYDYLTNSATSRSDHANFWNQQTGAILVVQNFFPESDANRCSGMDANPYYHSANDTLAHVNLATGTAITRAVMAALLGMAEAGLSEAAYLPVIYGSE